MLIESDFKEHLFLKGNQKLLDSDNIIAVIGSRKVSPRGAELAFMYAQYLAREKYVVANGLAIGTDTISIQGALSEKGATLAVLPSDVENIYPARNKQLAEQIISDGGCLVSQYSKNQSMQKYHFVERDKLLADIVNRVLIIECEEKSGTMHAVNKALVLGKDVAFLSQTIKGDFLVKKGCSPISNIEDLCAWLKSPKYEQLSLFG